MEEFFVLQFCERRVGPVLLVRHPPVLLGAEKVLDSLPAQVGLALLLHHQVGEYQQEAVAGYVESFQTKMYFNE